MAERALARTKRAPDAELMERVVVHNDLSRLTPAQRLAYYDQLCRSLGLNPLTRPFQYLTLSGRLTLYATKDCTEQLRRTCGISITRMESERDEDTYTVTVYGRDATGREDVATGVVASRNLAGEALANAKMKCETKAKRRLTLSLAGLGVLDESEVESVAIGGAVDVDPETGEIRSDLHRDALAESEPGPEPGAPNPEAELMLTKIQAGFDLLKVPAGERVELWRGFCGEGPFMSTEPDVGALGQLRDHLAARYKESKSKP